MKCVNPAVEKVSMSAKPSENITVAVRCRPFNSRERKLNSQCIVEMEGATTHLQQEGGKPKDFTFDFSYFWDTEQERVYTDLAKPIVEAAMTGYNGTIFAYGQTGSGKTWSMMGSPEQPGIIPQLNQDLFVYVWYASGLWLELSVVQPNRGGGERREPVPRPGIISGDLQRGKSIIGELIDVTEELLGRL